MAPLSEVIFQRKSLVPLVGFREAPALSEASELAFAEMPEILGEPECRLAPVVPALLGIFFFARLFGTASAAELISIAAEVDITTRAKIALKGWHCRFLISPTPASCLFFIFPGTCPLEVPAKLQDNILFHAGNT